MSNYLLFIEAFTKNGNSYISFPSDDRILLNKNELPETLEEAKKLFYNQISSCKYEGYILMIKYLGKNIESYGQYEWDKMTTHKINFIEIPNIYKQEFDEFILNRNEIPKTFQELLEQKKIIGLTKYDEVALKGQYYVPAKKHYDINYIVNCDNCKKQNILACIGIPGSNIDLCLRCADKILHDRKAHKFLITIMEHRYNKMIIKSDIVPKFERDEEKILIYFKEFMILVGVKPNIAFKNYIGYNYSSYLGGTKSTSIRYRINIVLNEEHNIYYVQLVDDFFGENSDKENQDRFDLLFNL
jgi:hypothetical protein